MKRRRAPSPAPSAALLRLRRRLAEKRKRRGVALIMVLGAITVLTVFLVELQEDTSASLAAALSDRDQIRAEYAAKSAVNISRLLVASEPAVRARIAPLFQLMGRNPPQIPVWAFADQVLGAFNSGEGAQSFAALAGIDATASKNTGMGDVEFEVRIVDEDSKLNLNSAAEGTPLAQDRFGAGFLGLTAPVQYNPLFEESDDDGQFSDRPTVCAALADWSDPDENQYGCNPLADGPAGGGSEDGYYDSLGLGYRRKNAPYDSLEELRLVRGVSDDFWATFVEPDPNDPDARIMTVWGQSRVNVNTANALTLVAVVCANAPEATLCNDPVQLESFVMVVTLLRNAAPGVPLFTSPKGFVTALEGKGPMGPLLTSLGIEPVKFKSKREMRRQIATDSKVFSVYADGVVKGFKRETRVRVHAVVDFRSASELGTAIPGQDTPTVNGEEVEEESSGPPSDEELAAAIASDPAGTVVYYRVE
jgi:general secretion pathway protein K